MGGVSLCQLSVPAPTPDQTWNGPANVQGDQVHNVNAQAVFWTRSRRSRVPRFPLVLPASLRKISGVARLAVLYLTIGVLTAACSPKPASAPATHTASVLAVGSRFLYVVSCDGRVDKLDTVEKIKIDSFLLSERSGTPPAVPAAPDGRMDGCLTQRVVADAKSGKVSLIAPRTARLSPDGSQEFQALTFSLPEWKLSSIRSAGRLPEAPRLELDAGGGVRIPNDAQWTPVMLMDLSKYHGQDSGAAGLMRASSGNTTLLSLLAATSKRPVFALADRSAGVVTVLDALPTTSLGHVHLAPGGGYVLVEVTQSADPAADLTGVLQLRDANGKRVGEWTDASLRGMVLVALTPNGTAVYRSQTTYRFLDLGRPFGNASVTKPRPELAEPGLVYAAK